MIVYQNKMLDIKKLKYSPFYQIPARVVYWEPSVARLMLLITVQKQILGCKIIFYLQILAVS